MRFPQHLAAAGLLMMASAVGANGAGPVEMSRQTITLPVSARLWRFADIDGDGRPDLLVIDPAGKRLFNYHQRANGFTNAPDQTIPLPPQTAWAALCDVESHPGLELLVSTANGLSYFRQNAGLFEPEPHRLIEASQVFTNSEFPMLTSLTMNVGAGRGTNELIPVISAKQVVLYQRNSGDAWSPRPPMTLEARPASWAADRVSSQWTLGGNPSLSLRVQKRFLANPDPGPDAEDDEIQKLVERLKIDNPDRPLARVPVDVDGDGREDLVLWRTSGKLDFKTDIYLCLRGADGQLPREPTQILHCAGWPVLTGGVSPVADLNGDGVCELIMIEPKSLTVSPGAFVDMALSHGVDWLLTIRTVTNGMFSRRATASLLVTTVLPLEELDVWPVRLQGDFNGDGLPDLWVRRSEAQWNIFFSKKDPTRREWFTAQPALTFNAPTHGNFTMQDINGDGLADIIWNEPDAGRLNIFLSPPRPPPAKNP